MIKRLFGMKTLCISQSRFNGFSHKDNNAYDLVGADSGIDLLRATCKLEVINVLSYEKTGFANTVFFYDMENDVTIACTHMNDISNYYVGQIFNDGDAIYAEGTKGKATGNHIHLEIGKGLQTKKKNINGTYKLINQINIEDYFYIDETVNVLDTKGIQFEVRMSNESKGSDNMEHLSGYQELNERGLEILLYAQKNGQKLGMISAAKSNAEYKVLKTLDKIDDDRIHYAKINANYFQMGGTEVGQHYGVEITPQVDLVPHQKEWLALWILKGEKIIKFDNSTKFNLSKNDVEFACSPYGVFYHDGVDCDYVSSACGNKKSVKNTQTFLIQLNETQGYQVILGVVKNKCYPKEIVEWAKAKFGNALLHLSLYDSGGSSQLIVNGEKKLFTSRAIANALTLYKDDTNKIYVHSTESTTTQETATETNLSLLNRILEQQIKELTEENNKLKAQIEGALVILGGK